MVLLPFCALMFGGVEFARLTWVRQALQASATAGSRCMGVLASGCRSGTTYSASATKTYIAARALKYLITVPASDMTVNNAATCAGVSNFSSVTLTYTFDTVAPLLVETLAGGQTLTATACFPNST